MRKLLTALFGVLVAAGPAVAQDEKPVSINLGFGWAFPTGDFKDSFDSGWNGTAGLTFNFNEHLGIRAEYIYARMDGPERTISVTATPIAAAATNGVLESNQHMHVGSFNLVYGGHGRDNPFGGYVLGGVGIYHRTVEITSPAIGFTTFCDPFWYVCYPTAVEVDRILGDRSSNDFGIDIGGGITFGRAAKFYVESRYHYVWGPTIEPSATVAGTTGPCAGGCSANASYFPLTFGVKW
jgi:opacity protein-like surface antigen